MDSVSDALSMVQNTLQRGFTKKTSSSFDSLLLTEAIADSQDSGTTLYAAFIAATKAFVVVCHDSLLVKLYDAGVRGRQWTFIATWNQW